MNHYIDIKIMPDTEKRKNVLLNKVFTKLHKTLNDQKQTAIGVSFPNYQVTLGHIVRLHGSKTDLQTMLQTNWLGGLAGYCKISEISQVPERIQGYRTISRIQQNMSESKLRRLIKRGSMSEEEAKNYRVKMLGQGLDNPYLELQSNSNGHKHRRYLQFGNILNEAVDGEFDHFGLSKTATIPWF